MFAGFWSNRCGAGQASALTAPWGLPVAVTNERTEKRAQLSFNFAWNYTDSEHASFGGLSRSGHILYIVYIVSNESKTTGYSWWVKYNPSVFSKRSNLSVFRTSLTDRKPTKSQSPQKPHVSSRSVRSDTRNDMSADRRGEALKRKLNHVIFLMVFVVEATRLCRQTHHCFAALREERKQNWMTSRSRPPSKIHPVGICF